MNDNDDDYADDEPYAQAARPPPQHAEHLDDLFDMMDEEMKDHNRRTRDPVAARVFIPAEGAFEHVNIPDPDDTMDTDNNEPMFGIVIDGNNMYEADNIQVYTIMTLGTWDLVPKEKRAELRAIMVVRQADILMTSCKLVPWSERGEESVAQFLVNLQHDGGFLCHVSTTTYKTSQGHELMAMTLLIRRIDEKITVTGALVFLMDSPKKAPTKAELELMELIGENDSDRPREEAAAPKPIMPPPPNTTDLLRRNGRFVNFFFETKPVSYEVEAMAIGDVA